MRNFSRTTLIGHVGKHINYQELENGKKVINFSIAYNMKGKTEKQNRTEWHKCTLWGKTATFLHNNLNTGDCLMVEGEYRSKPLQEGAYFAEMYLNVSFVQFISKKDIADINVGKEEEAEEEVPAVEPKKVSKKRK